MNRISEAIDMAQVNGSYSNIICSGDFNLKSVKWNEGIMDYEVGMCSQAEILATFMRNYFLLNHVNIPTRLNNVLDLVMSNVPDWFGKTECEINTNFSDHNFVQC